MSPKSPVGRVRVALFHGLVIGSFLAGLAATGAAFAQSANSQQERMKACNTQAGAQHLSGDARKSFMGTCLAGKAAPAAPTLTSQQQKMKDCNAQAGTKKLTGDARKSFMSTCLKG